MTVITNGALSAASLDHGSSSQNLLKHDHDFSNSSSSNTSNGSSNTTSTNSSSSMSPSLHDLPPFGHFYYNSSENKEDIAELISALAAATVVVQEQEQQQHDLATHIPLPSISHSIITTPSTPQRQDGQVVLQSAVIITTPTNDDVNKVQQHVNKGKKHRRQPSMRDLSASLHDEDYDAHFKDNGNNVVVVDDDATKDDIVINNKVHRHVNKKHRRQPSMRDLAPLLHDDDYDVIFEDRDDEDEEDATSDIIINKVHRNVIKKHRRQPSMRNLPCLYDDVEEIDAIFEDNDDNDDDRHASGSVGISHDDFMASMASNDGKEAEGNMKKKKKTIPNFICWERHEVSLVTQNTSMSSSLQGQPSMVVSLASCISSSMEEGNCFEVGLSSSSSSDAIATPIVTRPPAAASPGENVLTTMSSIDSNSDPDKRSTSRPPRWIVGIVDYNRQGSQDKTDNNINNNGNNVEFWLWSQENIGTSATTTTLYLKGPDMIRQVKSLDESSSRRRQSRDDKKFLVYLPGSTCFVVKNAAQAVRAIEAQMAAAAAVQQRRRRQEAPKSNSRDGAGGFRSFRVHFFQQLKKLHCPLSGESKSQQGQQESVKSGRNVWASSAAQAKVAKGDFDVLHL